MPLNCLFSPFRHFYMLNHIQNFPFLRFTRIYIIWSNEKTDFFTQKSQKNAYSVQEYAFSNFCLKLYNFTKRYLRGDTLGEFENTAKSRVQASHLTSLCRVNVMIELPIKP